MSDDEIHGAAIFRIFADIPSIPGVILVFTF